MRIKNQRGVSEVRLKKIDSFTLEMSKYHLIRNFLRNGRLRVNLLLNHLCVTFESVIESLLSLLIVFAASNEGGLRFGSFKILKFYRGFLSFKDLRNSWSVNFLFKSHSRFEFWLFCVLNGSVRAFHACVLSKQAMKWI